MKKIMSGAIITCLAILTFIYSPKISSAGIKK